ncbi:MAG: hypothetical protein FJW34_24375 [Acidobacteria bacterium]|nr:hypothetical protein [Acidobacteriota bacterium]
MGQQMVEHGLIAPRPLFVESGQPDAIAAHSFHGARGMPFLARHLYDLTTAGQQAVRGESVHACRGRPV